LFGAALAAFALFEDSRKTDSLGAAKSAECRPLFGAALAACALLTNIQQSIYIFLFHSHGTKRELVRT
jgi:hypothetical protein